MRGVPGIHAFLALPFRALAVAYDERNIRRLARRLGCTRDQAREVYLRAREEGFGAAHSTVLGSEAREIQHG
jgi:hypothetical protein